mgnify:FL=1|tara:strand:- start:249 stop:542 length:294 start_codon:yes stop_codon:yes gene_type:complete
MNATWSYDQTTLLREQYGKLPAVAIASLLGKTPNAIMQKANKMGLKSKLYHKVEIPLNTIINFRARGYSARKIGRLIGYSHRGVRWAEQNHRVGRGE